MTANGATHTMEEATVYVYDLDMFVYDQLLKEPHRGTFATKNV